MQREKNISAVSKKTEKETGGGGGAPDTEEKKKRDYLLEKLLSYSNIQKLILIGDPVNREVKGKDKEEKN